MNYVKNKLLMSLAGLALLVGTAHSMEGPEFAEHRPQCQKLIRETLANMSPSTQARTQVASESWLVSQTLDYARRNYVDYARLFDAKSNDFQESIRNLVLPTLWGEALRERAENALNSRAQEYRNQMQKAITDMRVLGMSNELIAEQLVEFNDQPEIITLEVPVELQKTIQQELLAAQESHSLVNQLSNLNIQNQSEIQDPNNQGFDWKKYLDFYDAEDALIRLCGDWSNQANSEGRNLDREQLVDYMVHQLRSDIPLFSNYSGMNYRAVMQDWVSRAYREEYQGGDFLQNSQLLQSNLQNSQMFQSRMLQSVVQPRQNGDQFRRNGRSFPWAYPGSPIRSADQGPTANGITFLYYHAHQLGIGDVQALFNAGEAVKPLREFFERHYDNVKPAQLDELVFDVLQAEGIEKAE